MKKQKQNTSKAGRWVQRLSGPDFDMPIDKPLFFQSLRKYQRKERGGRIKTVRRVPLTERPASQLVRGPAIDMNIDKRRPSLRIQAKAEKRVLRHAGDLQLNRSLHRFRFEPLERRGQGRESGRIKTRGSVPQPTCGPDLDMPIDKSRFPKLLRERGGRVKTIRRVLFTERPTPQLARGPDIDVHVEKRRPPVRIQAKARKWVPRHAGNLDLKLDAKAKHIDIDKVHAVAASAPATGRMRGYIAARKGPDDDIPIDKLKIDLSPSSPALFKASRDGGKPALNIEGVKLEL